MHFNDSATLGGIERTTEGYLTAFARTARTGVQLYSGDELGKPEMKVVRVLRDESEVFKKATISKFDMLPITIGHPKGGVTVKDHDTKSVGTTSQDIMRDGEFMRVGLKVMSEKAVKLVDSGTTQLSWGYNTELDWTPGVHPTYGAYDARQTEITPNHLAITPNARGGEKLNIGDDASLTIEDNQWGAAPITSEDEEPDMPTTRVIVVDGLNVETTDAGAQAITKLQDAATALEAKITAQDTQIAALTTDKETLTGEKAALTKQVSDSKITPAMLNDMAKKRHKVVSKAEKIMGKKPDDTMEDAAIMRVAVAHNLGDAMPADMADAAVEGAFLAIPVADSHDPLRADLGSPNRTVNDSGSIAVADADVYAQAGLKMKKGA